MYAAIPNVVEIALAVLILVLFTPPILILASWLVRLLGVKGTARPSYYKLSAIALGLWAAVLMLPLNIGGIVGAVLVWLIAYFFAVNTELRKHHSARAVLVSSYVALCSIVGLGVLSSFVYFLVLKL